VIVFFVDIYQQNKQSRLNSDGQQFHQYQYSKQSPLNSDGQQFNQYQQNKQSPLNSHHCLEVIVFFVDIGGIVDHHCLEVIVFFFILVELLVITA
jgi:hypothetical protein